jgi:hypothetical protein
LRQKEERENRLIQYKEKSTTGGGNERHFYLFQYCNQSFSIIAFGKNVNLKSMMNELINLSSPQKGHQGAPPAANQYPANLDISEDLVVEEECCWAGPSSVAGQSANLMMGNHHVPSTSNRHHHHHHHQTRGGPADGTALGIASHFQMNSLAKVFSLNPLGEGHFTV